MTTAPIANPSATAVRPTALDLNHVHGVRADLLAQLAVGALHIDLAAVAVCDVAGLQLLWAARRSAREHAQAFTVTAPSPAVAAAASAAGFDLKELQEQA